jgi:hypothetical protein
MFQRLLFHSRSAFSHSPPLRSSSLSPLCRTRLDTLTCPVRTMSGSDDDFSSRPAAKRVRSEQDHSKGDTKAREEKIQGEKNGENGKSGKGEEHHDEDWKKAPPFQIGESWEGWTTKWRSSCWCGKSESRHEIKDDSCHLAHLPSRFCVLRRPVAEQVLPLRRLPAPAR